MARGYNWARLDPSQKQTIATELVDRARLGDRFGHRLPQSILASHVVLFFDGKLRLSRGEERILMRIAKNSSILLGEDVGRDGRSPAVVLQAPKRNLPNGAGRKQELEELRRVVSRPSNQTINILTGVVLAGLGILISLVAAVEILRVLYTPLLLASVLAMVVTFAGLMGLAVETA